MPPGSGVWTGFWFVSYQIDCGKTGALQSTTISSPQNGFHWCSGLFAWLTGEKKKTSVVRREKNPHIHVFNGWSFFVQVIYFGSSLIRNYNPKLLFQAVAVIWEDDQTQLCVPVRICSRFTFIPFENISFPHQTQLIVILSRKILI